MTNPQTTIEEQIADGSTPKIRADVIETQHVHTRRILIDDGPILETNDRRKPTYQFRADRAVIRWHEGEAPETVGVYGRRILATGKISDQTVSLRYAVEELPEWLEALLMAATTPARRTVLS